MKLFEFNIKHSQVNYGFLSALANKIMLAQHNSEQLEIDVNNLTTKTSLV